VADVTGIGRISNSGGRRLLSVLGRLRTFQCLPWSSAVNLLAKNPQSMGRLRRKAIVHGSTVEWEAVSFGGVIDVVMGGALRM